MRRVVVTGYGARCNAATHASANRPATTLVTKEVVSVEGETADEEGERESQRTHTHEPRRQRCWHSLTRGDLPTWRRSSIEYVVVAAMMEVRPGEEAALCRRSVSTFPVQFGLQSEGQTLFQKVITCSSLKATRRATSLRLYPPPKKRDVRPSAEEEEEEAGQGRVRHRGERWCVEGC